jgi:alkaline phosphatase
LGPREIAKSLFWIEIMNRCLQVCLLSVVVTGLLSHPAVAQQKPDFLRAMQFQAVETKHADWIHWGDKPSQFSNWTTHSNRLIPVYTFGVKLDKFSGENSCYRSSDKLKALYGQVPESTLNPEADYFDQTDIYLLQKQALAEGKKNIILMIFDGMDWQTTQAAAIYKNKKVLYEEGRGHGLAFLDYGVDQGISDFGYFVCSAHNNGTNSDVDAQVISEPNSGKKGGYSVEQGGRFPWSRNFNATYLTGQQRDLPHIYTDSASSATSMCSGIKTYNVSINVDAEGNQVKPIARELQENGKSIGVITSVPFSHATPAAAYANNVCRDDYQDLARDLVGLPSVAHRDQPLPGVDVLIGGGWGEDRDDDRKKQGEDYVPGNKYLPQQDTDKIDIKHGGKYVVVQRTPGEAGREVLEAGTAEAVKGNHRLFGIFGVTGGHLPYQTADGLFDPTRGISSMDVYKPADITENPTLADMTDAALTVLETNKKGFWLMIEAGDVDWANHNNNIDDAIGAVFSGDAAFRVVTNWVEEHSSWDETAVIVTADHGHMMILDDPLALAGQRPPVDETVASKSDQAELPGATKEPSKSDGGK